MKFFWILNRWCAVNNTRWFVAIIAIGSTLFSTALHAQFNPPILEYQSASRILDVLVDYRLDEMNPGDGGFDQSEFNGEGVWPDSLQIASGPASANTNAVSNIGRFSVSGEAEVFASLQEVVYSGSAGALSAVSVTFTLPVDASFILTADFEFMGELATGWSRGQIALTGMDGQGLFLHEVDSEDPSTWSVLFNDSMTAGKQGFMTILIHAQRGRNPDLGDDETGIAEGRLEFSLDFGDRDQDGLLDVWEEEEMIDLGDGAVIDLSAFDPDPDKKDLFVEVDVAHVVPGIDIETDIVPMVVESFANAPAHLVNNPDESNGIKLHVFVDESLPAENAVLEYAGERTLPAEYYEVKELYLATPAHRAHPLWAAGPLKEAWLSIFRYSLWVKWLQIPREEPCMAPTACGPAGLSQVFGAAETIPGNDFVVAAGHLDCAYANTPESIPEDTKASMAGTFMHELGHTLGLTHGGGPDRATFFKSNYPSVMNYFYATPYVGGRDIWTLDYSEGALQTVDENELRELEGMDGPFLCRQSVPPSVRRCRIVFNSKPVDQPRPRWTIAYAFDQSMDWNNDGTISEIPLVPTVNTNWTSATNGCTGETTPVELEVLESYSDWDVLTLTPPPEELARNFGASNGPEPSRIEEMDQHMYFSVIDAEWFDQTASSGLPFSDGFESAPEAPAMESNEK